MTTKTSELQVIPIDTECHILLPEDSTVVGRVIGITIRSQDRISYEVAWWSGRVRYTDWFGTDEVSVAIPETSLRHVGFVGPTAASRNGQHR